MEHVYDFYKADLTSEYPIVDGHFSITCYTQALDKCYQHYNAKFEKRFTERVYPGTLAPRLVGNMYTASVYSSLASILVEIPQEKLHGQRIGVFSYGSGLAASFFSVKVVGDVSEIAKTLNLKQRLD